MKFLIDNALSPFVADGLREAGFDAIHVQDRNLQAAPDAEVLACAEQEHRVLVSADTDFGRILAFSTASQPSVVQFRRGTDRRPALQVKLLLANLPSVAPDLEVGAIVTIEQKRLRVRRLPVH